MSTDRPQRWRAAQAVYVASIALALLAGGSGCLGPMRGVGGATRAWVVDERRDAAATQTPLSENEIYSAASGRIELVAAAGETVAFQIALRAGRLPAGPYQVQIGELEGGAGKLPPPIVYRAETIRVEHFRSWYPAHCSRPATPIDVPDVLVPIASGGGLRLSEPGTGVLWVDVAVPRDASAGEYRAALEVRDAGGAVAFKAECLVRVLPLQLRPDDLPLVLCRVDPRELLAEQLGWPRFGAEETLLLPSEPGHQAALQLVQAAMAALHDHGATPLLWASFPKYRLADPRTVAMEWDAYDALVDGWLSGTAFVNQTPARAWLLPVSLEYPSAERNGGFESPQYARLLAAYLAECERHFVERGWMERSYVRPVLPAPLREEHVARLRRVQAIIRQSEVNTRLVAHLPGASLRGLGWYEAPAIDLAGVAAFAPPADWFEPAATEQLRALGQETWLQPGTPPYSPSLALEAPPLDASVLAWQAYRYQLPAIWIEHAADHSSAADAGTPWGSPPLLLPGKRWGIDGPLVSMRLKRLRRGMQDYALLRQLAAQGKGLLAASMAEQVVRWAGADACIDNLLSCRESGWLRDPYALWLARKVLVQELLRGVDEPGQEPLAASASQPAGEGDLLSDWARVTSGATPLSARVDGVRLVADGERLTLDVQSSVTNHSSRPTSGIWGLPSPPLGWALDKNPPVSLAGRRRIASRLLISMEGLGYNADGIVPFELLLDTPDSGAFAAPGRLAVATCPLVDSGPKIDGDLEGWVMAANNTAGDFLLVRGERPAEDGSGETTRQPTVATQAAFCCDSQLVYFAVQSARRSGEELRWQSDNEISIDGAVPWGQDVIELLLDPRGASDGTSGDLYCLQVKPSGLAVTRKGPRTEPPIGPSFEWPAQARVASRVTSDAWIVEVAIPLSAFGSDALRQRVWGVNVTRLDARRGEYASWSGARGYCYAPRLLGNLVFAGP